MLANTSFTAKNFVKPLYTCPTGKKAIVSATVLNRSGKEADVCLGVAPSGAVVNDLANNVDYRGVISKSPSGNTNEFFGYTALSSNMSSSSVDGEYVAVGSYGNDINGANRGRVYIYKFNDLDKTYTLIQEIEGNGSVNFGISTAMHSGYLYVGANNVINVYKFSNVSNTYNLLTSITDSTPGFGANIRANATMVVSTCYTNTATPVFYPNFYCYVRTGDSFGAVIITDVSTLLGNTGTLQPTMSIDISDNNSVVFGCPTYSTYRGKAALYSFNGSTFSGSALPSGTLENNTWYGSSVAISPNGAQVVVGRTLGGTFDVYAGSSRISTVALSEFPAQSFIAIDFTNNSEFLITSKHLDVVRYSIESGSGIKVFGLNDVFSAGTSIRCSKLSGVCVIGNDSSDPNNEPVLIFSSKSLVPVNENVKNGTIDKVTLPINATFERTGIELKAGETVFVTSSQDYIGNTQSHNAFVFGIEESV